MPEGYSYEIREIAKDLFVTEGYTYDQVARSTGVSVAQLKRWGKDEDWTDARREYREALSSIKRDTVKLRAKLLKTALGSGDPQSVYAFAAIEKAVAAGKRPVDAAPVSNPERLKNINTPSDAVAALQEVVELKLNKMLSQPDTLQLSQVRELKQTMELIDQMKAKYNPDAGGDTKVDGGLSDEAADMIRRQILGVS
ncbi:MAG: hypothetical protein KKF12_17585 [Proteobacteria bacterium]|nr:hypothetical protein [Desulfobacula sp.]MBU3953152.1 hypothetical protein [Pseudomonadota bacterium]MBU4132632.1 hypothetical protein [Pseudomonadota bacterium]